MRSKQVLEIRVHGVSNTPPQSVLLANSEQDITRVAGDEVTGFYQRNDQDPLALVQTQAYSWGQLTAGVRAKKDLYRALWMLLLPFALVNVAFWSRSEFPDQTQKARTGGLTSYLARLLAASLTVTLILAATGVGVDLIGWQWQRADPRAVKAISWLGFLTDQQNGWWSVGARPLAVGLLVPAGVLAVIYAVARKSFGYEAEVSTVVLETAATETCHMASPDFWRGDRQVRQLAAAHVAIAAAAACSVTVGPVVRRDSQDGDFQKWPGFLLLAGLAVLLILALVLLAMPAVTDRDDDHESQPRGSALAKQMPFAALAAFVLSAIYLMLHHGLKSSASELPGFDATVRALFLCQVLVLVALAMSARWSPGRSWIGVLFTAAAAGAGTLVVTIGPDRLTRHFVVFLCVLGGLVVLAAIGFLTPSAAPVLRTGQSRAYGAEGMHANSLNRPAWRGAGAALLAGIGLLLGALYAAGILFFVGDWLTTASPAKGEAAAVHPPDALGWAAAGLVPFVVVLACGVAIVLVKLNRRSRSLVDAVPGANASPHARARARSVAKARAFHEFMSDQVLDRVGMLAALAFIGVIVACAAAATGKGVDNITTDKLGPILVILRDVGTKLCLGLLALIVLAGGLVYRAKPERRAVGVIWDLATFWPRACHPFAPPCYAERCVPQLVTRIAGDDVSDGFVLAGHSQGAVLLLATVLQLPESLRKKVFLLTFGTQLHRLYGRGFPAFFGPVVLREVASLLQQDEEVPTRRWLRWRSLYRQTDPLGYPVDVTVEPRQAGQEPKPPEGVLCVDHSGVTPHKAIPDPQALHPAPREILDPPIRKHSNYPADPIFGAVRDDAADRLTGRVPMSQRGPSRAVPTITEG